jgi:hypothetical protein
MVHVPQSSSHEAMISKLMSSESDTWVLILHKKMISLILLLLLRFNC